MGLRLSYRDASELWFGNRRRSRDARGGSGIQVDTYCDVRAGKKGSEER
jgi:hypothetical protein